ncbi:hypothetical protein [Sulfitobacter sp.]|uniref:hypothetical protein n=1 Tax=Sulfitobacter sp. TaxID=1903071 RepID=UPI003003249C
MTVTIAFYKGQGVSVPQRLQEGLIRSVTRGIYSHVEMISGDALHDHFAVCLSASGRDGGVREKCILLKPESWDLVSMRMDAEAPCQFIREHLGARYDYAGLILSQVLALGRHNPDKWFCSEICAAALGLPNPQRVSP